MSCEIGTEVILVKEKKCHLDMKNGHQKWKDQVSSLESETEKHKNIKTLIEIFLCRLRIKKLSFYIQVSLALTLIYSHM